MKFNEPVRPAGIGKGQVAFDVSRRPSQLTLNEIGEGTTNATDSLDGVRISAIAESSAIARAAAYSAASSAMSNNTNRIWSTQSIKAWTHYSNNSAPTSSLIHWADDVDNLQNIRTGLAYVDTTDPTIIRVTKAGWYLVNVHFYEGDHQLNNNKNILSVVSADSPDTSTALAYNFVTGYPSLYISQLVPVPGYNSTGEPTSPSSSYGQGGFQVAWIIGPHTANLDITSTNSYAYIQIVWLMPWESNLFYNGA